MRVTHDPDGILQFVMVQYELVAPDKPNELRMSCWQLSSIGLPKQNRGGALLRSEIAQNHMTYHSHVI